jgi:glycosyltransferase involved in cell wall biosynthesis
MAKLSPDKTVRILGTHGVPAAYGGFETAAENVGLFLARTGWRVIVYCQVPGSGPVREDTWKGLERVLIPVDNEGWLGTSKFDLISVRHASRFPDICLTFGYNTAIFNVLQRIRQIPLVINMDGIEWSRSRWGFTRQAILYLNERIGCYVGNDLIADHPEIEKYLLQKAPQRKLSTITYGANAVTEASADFPLSLGLEPGRYLTLICRPIPENSILELVKGFSSRPRGYKLVILGKYDPEIDPYHAEVMNAANGDVIFAGPVYEPERVSALRFHSACYLHGHTVGGTNPSLVEAMAAGNPVIAHDNPYNRWVVREGAAYFTTAQDVADRLDEILCTPGRLESMRSASRLRHEAEFTWEHVAGQYEELISRHLVKHASTSAIGDRK